jgi:hypothetical protein
MRFVRNSTFITRQLVFAVALLAIALTAQASVTEEEVFSFPINSDGRFSLDNINGDIHVVAGSGSTIEVVATKRSNNQEGLDRITIEIKADDNYVAMYTELHKKGGWFGGDNRASVDYYVTLPATITLNSVESVNGEIVIEGVTAKVKAETINGSIEASGLAGDAHFESVNGEIEARFVKFDGHQRAKADTVNGSITIRLPDDADCSVTAESLNGNMRGGDFDLEVNKGRFVGRDMNGDIGEGSGRLSLDSVNGSIRVTRN